MHVMHCKLKHSEQLRLMEYFVAGIATRTAADLVSVHRCLIASFIPILIDHTTLWMCQNSSIYRINRSALFAHKRKYINGIKNFWNQAKRHMRKFNGVPKDHFNLFLKECERRFNLSSPKQLLRDLKVVLKGYCQVSAPILIFSRMWA